MARNAAAMLIVAGGLYAATLPARAPPVEPLPDPYEVEQRKKFPAGFDERKQAIEKSLKATRKPIWAGHYFEGDGLGANINVSLTPDAGMVTTWNGCLGVYGANHGSLVDDNGVIRVNYVGPNKKRKFGNFENELVPVSWGERQYLIPPDRIASFVSSINRGLEPRDGIHGNFLLRKGDEAKPIAGLPTLPPGTTALVRSEPATARLAAVLRPQGPATKETNCIVTYVVSLEPTTPMAVPLFVGEELESVTGLHQIAEVIAVSGQSVEAEVFVTECGEKWMPQPGTMFTTGAYDAARRRRD